MLSALEGTDRLKIFRADLNEDRSFDKAVKDCAGLFHVAASMEFGISVQENVGNLFQIQILCIQFVTLYYTLISKLYV